MSHFDQMTPAPWESDGIRLWGREEHGEQPFVGVLPLLADLAGVRDLRNAMDVQMRRGWYSEQVSTGRWRLAKVFRYTLEDEAWWEQTRKEFDSPITPLLEADVWCKANVDGRMA
jgi:hypothetical protein